MTDEPNDLNAQLDALGKTALRIKAERDELLAALKTLYRAAMDLSQRHPAYYEALNGAHDTIRRAEGK